jgi:endonuclease/exonuclease/phosphatase family metal-dependent hydrolase
MDDPPTVATITAMKLRAALLSSVLVSSTGCTAVQRILAPDDAPTRRSVADNTVRHARDTVRRGLTIATWNIRAGKDASLDGLAARIAALDADVVALQEVEVGTKNAAGLDQSWELAQRLGMERAFTATLSRDGGLYGIALLSKKPIRSIKRIELPGAMGLEPRVVLDAVVDDDGRPVHVLVTHADVLPWAGARHATAIAEAIKARVGEGVVLLGDFNLTPETRELQDLIRAGLRDTVAAFDRRPTGPPWPSRSRIDYVFMDEPMASRVETAAVVDTDGSDHLPVVVRLKQAPRVDIASAPPAQDQL